MGWYVAVAPSNHLRRLGGARDLSLLETEARWGHKREGLLSLKWHI